MCGRSSFSGTAIKVTTTRLLTLHFWQTVMFCSTCSGKGVLLRCYAIAVADLIISCVSMSVHYHLHVPSCVQVFRAYDIEAGSEVALKIHTVDSKVFSGAAQKEYVRRAIREVAILEGVRHQCVVRLHHVFQISDTSFAIVMEACKGPHRKSPTA